ncbi:hypothetical protein KI387_014554 [Taxus chinensis]|uniref:Tafazzin family protein n=1 Tax=Taxus chinensis TaxID=29808 RepID=A0AA38CNG9_TAXCH|nr:hypothetical protein KI387_014554 [Taxus chinensis]
MEWAAKDTHLKGIPRRIVISAAGAFAKLVTSFLNTAHIHNADTLLHFIKSRPPGTPLITVSNHMSTLDDPLMWGFKGSPIMDWKRARWTLAAEDICFTNTFYSYFFRLGKCIPITRGAGIYQTNMNEALDRINAGEWLHTFPEGKISQGRGPMRRLKWGTASLIARSSITPIVLPIAHSGFEKVNVFATIIFLLSVGHRAFVECLHVHKDDGKRKDASAHIAQAGEEGVTSLHHVGEPKEGETLHMMRTVLEIAGERKELRQDSNIFCTRYQTRGKCYIVVVNSGSPNNLVSAEMV